MRLAPGEELHRAPGDRVEEDVDGRSAEAEDGLLEPAELDREPLGRRLLKQEEGAEAVLLHDVEAALRHLSGSAARIDVLAPAEPGDEIVHRLERRASDGLFAGEQLDALAQAVSLRRQRGEVHGAQA